MWGASFDAPFIWVFRKDFMYKIIYLPTGHVFELPDKAAIELKDNFPDDYRIIEKNGKRVRETSQKKAKKIDNKSIYSKVVEE